MCIKIPKKIRKMEGKTAFFESGQAVSMTLTRARKGDLVIAQIGLILKVPPKGEAEKH
jgi:hydrogenase maturation factor